MYFVYKLPLINDYCATCPHVSDGLAYLYLDANNPNEWKFSEQPLNSSKQAIAYTLDQMYTNWKKEPNVHLVYNDQVPHNHGFRDSSYRGHAKGVVYFEKEKGFWLIHSVPRFVHPEHYEYPESGTRNGQSMLCVSFNKEQALDEIAHQMYYMQPHVYVKQNTLGHHSEFLDKVIKGYSVRDAPFTRQATLTSAGGFDFVHFAKHKKWNEGSVTDLYAHLVAPGLHTSLFVETWLNGNAADLLSVCNVAHGEVHNLREVKPHGIPFKSSKDHSKWAVSGESANPWTCIGDINRQSSQDDRAGGTLCLKNTNVWAAYASSAISSETCDSHEHIVPTNLDAHVPCTCPV